MSPRPRTVKNTIYILRYIYVLTSHNLGIYQAKSCARVVVYMDPIDQIGFTSRVCFRPYLPHEQVGYERLFTRKRSEEQSLLRDSQKGKLGNS